jgi:tripartite-type tricarboxylate transporter receptor subunit TctC
MKAFKKIARISLVMLALAAPFARANDFPAKPVTMVIPFAPGGFVHLVGLMLSESMSATLKQPVVLVNQPGANGVVAATNLTRAAPDGYTVMLVTTSILAVTPHLVKTVQFDARNDFSAVGMVANTSNIFVVSPKSGIKTFKDLADRARQKPEAVSYGSSGNGSIQHISGEVLQREVGTKVLHVPYKGTGPALVDLVGGQLSFVLGDASALPYVQAGTLNAIAVSPRPRAALPGVPSLTEAAAAAGLPKYVIPTLWYGIIGPKGVPQDVLARLNGALAEALAKPAIREKLIAGGATPTVNNSSAFLQDAIRSDFTRYGEMLKTINVTVD